MGIASLVLGIVGIVCAITFVLAPLGVILAVIGLILGIVDVVKKGKSGGKKGISIAGLIICAIIFVVVVVETLIVIGLGVYIYDEAKDAMDNVDLSSQVVSSFNSSYEYYKGEQSGIRVKSLVSLIKTHNIVDEDKNITCKLDGIFYDEDTIASKIVFDAKYNVSFDYDIDGYIYNVNIETKSVNNVNTEVNNNVQEANQLQRNDNISIYNEIDEEEISNTLTNYYKLLSEKQNAPSLMLKKVLGFTVYGVQDQRYAPDSYVEHPNSYKYSWTGIKYEDFRGKIWYISDNVLSSNFPEFVEYKDYLYIEDNPNLSTRFNYEIVKKEYDNNSTEKICISNLTIKNTINGEQFNEKVTMKRGNGNFIITDVEKY